MFDGRSKKLFLSCENRVLDFQSDVRTREKDVLIEATKWPSEKTALPLKHADRRFHSAARPQNGTAE